LSGGVYRIPKLSARLDEILEPSKVVIEPVTAEHAKIARQAGKVIISVQDG
jgi:hypothetical protein